MNRNLILRSTHGRHVVTVVDVHGRTITGTLRRVGKWPNGDGVARMWTIATDAGIVAGIVTRGGAR